MGCVVQGLAFIADNKEEQSRTLMANVASVNEELEGIVASLHTGTCRLHQHMRWAFHRTCAFSGFLLHMCRHIVCTKVFGEAILARPSTACLTHVFLCCNPSR
jgi:hypothetical protein